jgi:hypothetical protein
MEHQMQVHLWRVLPGAIKMMNTTCQSLVRFEERAAAIYMNFARRFADSRELASYWLEMSMEDKEHAVLLQFCGCEELFSETMPDRTAIRSLAQLFSGLEHRASGENLSVDDAFLIAGELETSEINTIYTRLVAPVKGTSYVVRKKTETLEVNHVQSLIRGARKFRISAPTIARLIHLKRLSA